jgi:hypothetical protein
MKELSIEEKAKAYDVAIEKIQKYVKDDYGCTRLRPEDIFPELNESEDEKTMKELIEQVAYIVPNDDEVDSEGNVLPTYQKRIDKYRAWLEKQGKQKPIGWSEEDKKHFDNIIQELKNQCDRPINASYKEIIVSDIDWLKSLKDRVQSQNIVYYNPYKEAVESIAKTCDRYEHCIENEFEARNFLIIVKAKCKDVAEHDEKYPQK